MKLPLYWIFLLLSAAKGNVEDEVSNMVKVYGKNGNRKCSYGINEGKLGTLTLRLIDQLEKRKSMDEKFKKALNNCGPNKKNRPKSCQSTIVQSLYQRYFGNTKIKNMAIPKLMRELKEYKRKIDKCMKHKTNDRRNPPCRRLECVIFALYSDCFKKKKYSSSCLTKISNPKLPNSAERKIIAASTYLICRYLKVGQCTVSKKSRYQPACAKELHRALYVLDGDKSMKNAWPWTVSLKYKEPWKRNEHRCGGSLIHNQLVITAAHCVQNLNISLLSVVTGEHILSWKDKGEKEIKVQYYYLHKKRKNKDYDIAVLKLKTSNNNKKVARPICLGTKSMLQNGKRGELLVGWKCFVVGWGRTENDLHPAHLRQALVLLDLEKSTCHRSWWSTGGGG